MGDSGVLVSIVLGDASTLGTLVLVGTTTAGVALLAARRCRWGVLRGAAAVVAAYALALVPAVTLSRQVSGVEAGRLVHCVTQVGGPLSTHPEALLNLGLLVPAAFFGVLAVQRARAVVAALLVVSVLVEAGQAVLGSGVCESVDVARNVVGAVGGAAAGWALLRVVQAQRRGSSSGGPLPGGERQRVPSGSTS